MKFSHLISKVYVFQFALMAAGPLWDTCVWADTESRHTYLSDGLVRSAPGRLSDAICEFIKDDIFYFQVVYCSATPPSSPPSTCACKTRKSSSTPLTVNDFEAELKEANAKDSEIDEIIQNIVDGAQVDYRDRLFVLAFNALENRDKEIEKAKALELEKKKAEEAKIAAEEARHRVEYSCTAAGTRTSRGYNNGIGRPIPSYTWPFRVDCTGCSEPAVREETRLKFMGNADGAIIASVSMQSLNCFAKPLSYKCTSSSINCKSR